jgi:hypothetical protein
MDQAFDSFRKASESTVQMQQEMFKQWSRMWPTTPINTAGMSADWLQSFQKRWVEFVVDSMNRQRESLDSAYKAGVQMVEGTLRLADSKSPDEFRKAAEEQARKNYETFKTLTESQLKDFQAGAEKWFEMMPKAKV